MSWASLETFLDGGKVTLCLIVALGFTKLGVRTADRLYYLFAIAFLLLGTSWVLLGLGAGYGEGSVYAFLPRLGAFLVIIAAIVDKNRRAGGRGSTE